MKRKVLYVISSFGTGGICRALQNTLNLYDTEKYDVEVFALIHEGLYKGEFKHCKVLKHNYLLEAICISYYSLHGVKRIVGYSAKILNKLLGGRLMTYIMGRAVNTLVKKGNYNAVIAYSEGLPTKFIAEAKHNNKIAWIHCDYQSYLRISPIAERKIYEKIDKVVCVSDYTRISFLQVYPNFIKKTKFVYNVLDEKFIKQQSTEDFLPCYEKKNINIVSVGRIDSVKRFSSIPAIVKELKKNYEVKWYIVGPAVGNYSEYDKLLENIKTNGVKEEVILLGEKSNPYPYIRHADILACTSVSEACPYVINEAKILEVPIVCTNFGSSVEFIKNNEEGIITSIESFHEAITRLIENKKLYNHIKFRLSEFEYGNKDIMSDVYTLINTPIDNVAKLDVSL